MIKDSKSEMSKIEKILYSSAKTDPMLPTVEFSSVPDCKREKIIVEVTKECKKYVIGALYNDFDGFLYSFNKKDSGIYLNDKAYDFILKYKTEIETLNYYSWAKFLEQINDDDLILRLLDKLELSTPKRSDLSIYREILYKEYEQKNCFYCGKRLGSQVHVDHFIPWSFVKDDKIWNFVLACPKCNTKKNNKLASKAYICRLKERNRNMCNDIALKHDFDSYADDLIDEMWQYARMSGFKEV